MSITFNPNAEVQNVNFLKWIILIKIFMITWIYSQKIEPIIPIFWARDEEGEGESWILVDGGKNHNKVSTQTQYPISRPRPSTQTQPRLRIKGQIQEISSPTFLSIPICSYPPTAISVTFCNSVRMWGWTGEQGELDLSTVAWCQISNLTASDRRFSLQGVRWY